MNYLCGVYLDLCEDMQKKKIDQLVTQHAKHIILYDLETKTIKGLERMKFLNMN